MGLPDAGRHVPLPLSGGDRKAPAIRTIYFSRCFLLLIASVSPRPPTNLQWVFALGSRARKWHSQPKTKSENVRKSYWEEAIVRPVGMTSFGF
jgi:hypothetical protein